MASSVHPDACEEHCVEGILSLTKDRVWAVRVAAAAALPAIARGQSTHIIAYCSGICFQISAMATKEVLLSLQATWLNSLLKETEHAEGNRAPFVPTFTEPVS